uniref:UDP-glycosyltransferases domain-containing protein n=1 Tax=Heliothis virescens TaxID=7102 RepID=A0A2A4JV21_HELVI
MKLTIVLLLGTISYSCGYHILVPVPTPSHSHNQLAKGLVDALLKNGHTVTWATPFPEKAGKNPPKNLKLIDLSHVKHFADIDMTDPKHTQGGIAFVKQFAANVSTAMLVTPSFKEALTKNQYDAVITELFFCDFLAGIAAVQQVPWLVLVATDMYPNPEAQIDEVRSVTTTPLLFNPADVPMSFGKRAINFMIYIAMTVSGWLDQAKTVEVYESIFSPIAAARGVALPSFEDAFYNVSVMFVNSHESISPPFSTPPNVINIAGYHIDENIPPLPKDLQELLDGSPQGVIYFSMGSVLKSAAFKPELRAALLKIFAKLPYTVLWKFEQPISDVPPNVHVRPWMPQPSILAHPNVKLFITHGGQLSSLEAIFAGVPVLAVPVFGDQPSNAERARRRGYALRVDFSPDMAPEIEAALNEMLGSDKYYNRANYLSKIFRNRPSKPSDLINHYVELAIETKGAPHLRSLSLKYKWYERWMLDFALVVLGVLVALILLVTFAIKKCIAKDLQELLDGSPQGVIYFSMGSVLKSAAFKPELRAALLKIFAKLPYTVLWKFEQPIGDVPPNVHVRPWMPQPSILAHPNVKLFITHGGQLSSLEAIFAGVPVLAVPVFGDQPSNAERARRRGYALRVDFSPDMAPEIEAALNEMLGSDKYYNRVKYLSKIFRNRPSKPSDLINHYVELAIETKGAPHLRSLSLKYKWYERWMLDFALVVLGVLAALILLVTFAIKKCIAKVTGTKTYKPSRKTKKQ